MNSEINDLKVQLLLIRNEKHQLELDMQKSLAWASHWDNYATSDANHARMVYNGFEERLTSLELEQEAYETSSRHMRHYDDLKERMLELDRREIACVKLILSKGGNIS